MSTGQWYRDGTVAVVQGSAEVTGTTTLWSTQVKAGDLFTITGAKFYEVLSIATNGALTLRTPYLEETLTGVGYAIVRNFTGTMQSDIAAKLADLVYRYHVTLDELANWMGGSGQTAVLHDSTGAAFTVSTPARLNAQIAQVEAAVVDVSAATTAANNAGAFAATAQAAAATTTAAADAVAIQAGVVSAAVDTVTSLAAASSSAAGISTAAAEAAALSAQNAAAAAGGGVTSFNGRSGAVVPTSADITTALGFTPIDATQKGAANGIAALGSDGKVPASQLPSFVDDVIECANFAALPATGESGKIYVLATPYTNAGVTSSQFRWGGTAYAPIIASPGTTDAVAEGVTNLYFTAARVIAASPVKTVQGRTGDVVITKADLGIENVNNTTDANKPVSIAQQAALDAKQATAAKDASGGYVGMTLYKINFRDGGNQFTSFLTNANTAAHTYTFPNKDGTVAMLSDISGVNSGTNTGDETAASIKTKLGITTLSGPNTGDNAANSNYANDYRAANFIAGTHYVAPGSAINTGQPASSSIAAATGNGGFQFMSQGSGATAGAAFMSFHRPNSYATYFGLDIDNKLKWGGWTAGAVAYEMFHEANVQTQTAQHHNNGQAYLDKGNSGTAAQTLVYTAATHQKLTVTGAFTLSTSGWPPSGRLGELSLELVNGAAFGVTWPTINWVKQDGTTTTSFASNGVALQASGTDWILLWSRDGGTTIYGKVMR